MILKVVIFTGKANQPQKNIKKRSPRLKIRRELDTHLRAGT